MKRAIAVCLCVFASGAIAQPKPELDEPVGAYLHRYSQWWQSAPARERAWELMQAIEKSPDWEYSASDLATNPDDERWESSREFVRTRPEMIELILDYAGRNTLAMPVEAMIDPDVDSEKVPPTISILSPQLGPLMKHARLLVVDALIGAEQGDHARVIRNFEAVVQLRQHAVITGSLVEKFVEYAMLAPLHEAILSDRLDLGLWSGDELSLLASVIENTCEKNGPSAAIRYERWHSRSVIDWLYVDSDDGLLTARGADRLLQLTEMLTSLDDGVASAPSVNDRQRHMTAAKLVAKVKPKAEQVALVDKVFDLARSACAVAPHRLERFESSDLMIAMSSGAESGLAYAPALIPLPDMTRLYARGVHAQARRNAARLIVAINRHRIDQGSFPEAIDELDRAYLPVDPADPFSGEWLHYRLIDGHPMIYSVGTDRDDDKGSPLLGEHDDREQWHRFIPLDNLDAMSATELNAIDGDWILYPPAD